MILIHCKKPKLLLKNIIIKLPIRNVKLKTKKKMNVRQPTEEACQLTEREKKAHTENFS